MSTLIERVIDEACRQSRRACTRHDVLGPSARRDIVRVRDRAIYAVMSLRPKMSLPQIGVVFGRHHTTILTARDRHAIRRDQDPAERAAAEQLVAVFRTEQVPA